MPNSFRDRHPKWYALLSMLGYFSIYLAAQLFVSFIMGIVVAVKVISEGPYTITAEGIVEAATSPVVMAVILFVSPIITLLIYWLIMFVPKTDIRKKLDLNPIKWQYALYAILIGLAANPLFSIAVTLLPISEEMLSSYEQASSSVIGSVNVFAIIGVVILAPIIEEVLFRGIIYKGLKSIAPMWVAIIAQGLIFGLMHGNIIWSTATCIISFALVFLYERTKSLAAPIIAHIALNSYPFIFMVLFPNI